MVSKIVLVSPQGLGHGGIQSVSQSPGNSMAQEFISTMVIMAPMNETVHSLGLVFPLSS